MIALVVTVLMYVGLPSLVAWSRYGAEGAALMFCGQVLAFILGVVAQDQLESRKPKEGK